MIANTHNDSGSQSHCGVSLTCQYSLCHIAGNPAAALENLPSACIRTCFVNRNKGRIAWSKARTGSLFPLITRRPYQRGGICMNTLKGNEEAVRRGSFGAALGIGELSERYMMDLSSWDEKQNEVEFNSATNGSCCQVFVHAGNVGAEASHLMCCIWNAKLNISVLKLWILSFLKHEWICTLTLKR